MRSRRTKSGYAVEEELPLAFLNELAGAEVSSIGFDVAVDDADWQWARDAQMVWAGVAENYLDPSAFGRLVLGEQTVEDAVVTLW